MYVFLNYDIYYTSHTLTMLSCLDPGSCMEAFFSDFSFSFFFSLSGAASFSVIKIIYTFLTPKMSPCSLPRASVSSFLLSLQLLYTHYVIKFSIPLRLFNYLSYFHLDTRRLIAHSWCYLLSRSMRMFFYCCFFFVTRKGVIRCCCPILQFVYIPFVFGAYSDAFSLSSSRFSLHKGKYNDDFDYSSSWHRFVRSSDRFSWWIWIAIRHLLSVFKKVNIVLLLLILATYILGFVFFRASDLHICFVLFFIITVFLEAWKYFLAISSQFS